ncbi:MAG: sigma-54-dependent Fis family transcriptional regulator [Desulfovibrionaceae bacterium]|jgi:two-component system response regulator AtoC|nr:sigma-54-dependent Fis family transcriptional regulator [Desulfovibrionaceae bacterium]
MNRQIVLIVDDEPEFREAIAERIRLRGMEPLAAPDGDAALAALRSARVDMAIVDYVMPGMDGLVTVTKLREINPGLRTVLLTGKGGDKVRQASEALDTPYFDKADMAAFWEFVQRVQAGGTSQAPVGAPGPGTAAPGALSAPRPPAGFPAPAPAPATPVAGAPAGADAAAPRRTGLSIDSRPGPLNKRLLGQTPVMRDLFEKIAKLAVLDCSVLLLGETGTGKATIARTIHELNPRATGPFLGVDCQMFNADLLAQELFGLEVQRPEGPAAVRRGLIEDARGGAIFLDEIGALAPATQNRLAGLVDSQSFTREGGGGEVVAEVRILAASSGDLEGAVARGFFREDLYARLATYVLRVPPLRERAEDIPLISRYFLHKYAAEFETGVRHISGAALERLMGYSFPGNVRELESIIESAVITAEGATILPEHLPELDPSPRAALHAPSGETLVTLAEVEDAYIRQVIAATKGNKNLASDILGISRSSLWRKLKRMNGDF